MSSTTAWSARRHCVGRGLLAAALLLAGAGVSYLAASETLVSVERVEEEWELVVSEADPDRDAPQVTAVFSPLGNLNGLYAAFELNHQTQPTYAGGGLQLQVWSENEVTLATRTHKDGENLSHANEVVTWTQELQLANGQLTFRISNGNSTSWGSFGGPLHATVPTSLSNLNAYNPLVSVNGSGVGFASHRVASLKLKKLRIHLTGGQVLEDNTERVAFPKN